MSEITVKCAVYGALAGGNENRAQASDVTLALQKAIDSMDGIVKINNDNMGVDPCPKRSKHFGAVITRCDSTKLYYYACGEGQTVDFKHGGQPPS